MEGKDRKCREDGRYQMTKIDFLCRAAEEHKTQPERPNADQGEL